MVLIFLLWRDGSLKQATYKKREDGGRLFYYLNFHSAQQSLLQNNLHLYFAPAWASTLGSAAEIQRGGVKRDTLTPCLGSSDTWLIVLISTLAVLHRNKSYLVIPWVHFYLQEPLGRKSINLIAFSSFCNVADNIKRIYSNIGTTFN